MGRNAKKIMRNEACINFLTNCFCNSLCAWLLHRGALSVPMDFWNVLIDTFLTSYFVALCTTGFCSLSGRRYLASGVFLPKEPDGSLISDLPGRPLLMGLTLAGCGVLVWIPVFGGFFTAAGITALPVWQFILFKGIWGGVFGMLVCIAVLNRCRFDIRRGGR